MSLICLFIFYFFFISVHLSFVVRGWNDETEPSVLAPELHLGWKSELRSLPRSLAGRPMTRRTQQLTGQRSRRLNSKSWLPALWLQSCKKRNKKKKLQRASQLTTLFSWRPALTTVHVRMRTAQCLWWWQWTVVKFYAEFTPGFTPPTFWTLWSLVT